MRRVQPSSFERCARLGSFGRTLAHASFIQRNVLFILLMFRGTRSVVSSSPIHFCWRLLWPKHHHQKERNPRHLRNRRSQDQTQPRRRPANPENPPTPPPTRPPCRRPLRPIPPSPRSSTPPTSPCPRKSCAR